MTTDYAARHRQFAAAFQNSIQATRDWDAATPVPEWTARDVVFHLVTWLPPLLRDSSDVRLPDRDRGEDPAVVWREHASAVQQVLDDGKAGRALSAGPFAGQPLDATIDRIYTADVFMHTWDLAAASGLSADLDPEYARQLLVGLRPIEDMLRESGQYGPARTTASDDPARQLMAFVGRDVDAFPTEPARGSHA